MKNVYYFIFLFLFSLHCGPFGGTNGTESFQESSRPESVGKYISTNDSNTLYTIAFEDSFPLAGDGDYNDYVVVANYDIKKEGELVAGIKASFSHVARGSASRQILMLRLPVNTNVTFKHRIYNANGSARHPETLTSIAAANLAEGIVILPDDSENSLRNVSHGQQFQPGQKAEVEIVFETPVATIEAPFDLYLFLPNTNQEVHITDINKNGFPAAVAVPGVWKWQYENASLYDEKFSGYAGFDKWVKTGAPTDWYRAVTDGSRIYPLSETDIAGFIMGKSDKNIVIVSALLLFLGIFLGFYLRKKTVEA